MAGLVVPSSDSQRGLLVEKIVVALRAAMGMMGSMMRSQSSNPSADGGLDACRSKMLAAGVSEVAIRAFEFSYRALATGAEMMVPEATIRPVESLPLLEELNEGGKAGEGDSGALLEKAVVIKLNGGLGTGMGLQKAKSLLEVRDGMTFLDLTARQILALRGRFGMRLRFLLMNSFSTSRDTLAFLAKYPELGAGVELEFLQSQAPKLDAETLRPVAWPPDPALEWCPPGHGDLYPALLASGRLESLLAAGVRYAFVSNADNLGATLDLALLRHFADSEMPFLMEVTRRTEADRKGGHLAVDLATGGLLLRESSQCPDADGGAFQDIERHRFFNTNNLWVRIDRLKEGLDAQGGFLPLAVIRNRKTVDPRDPASSAVYQLETAMGAAIACFEGAGAVEVSRARFAPVKTTEDLFALRSDAYEVTPDFRLELHPDRKGIPPVVKLDAARYKLVDQLEAAIPDGAPGLRDCERLEVSGPVRFAEGVRFRGAATVKNPGGETRVLAAGTYSGEVVL